MTAAREGNLYMVFVMRPRGEEAEVLSLRPQTPDAERKLRANTARVKVSWGARRKPVRISFGQEKRRGQERNGR